MTTYLIHTTLLLSGFTLFYWFILRHETYFRLNRWVILGSVLFCLALPLIEVPSSLSLWSQPVVPTENIIESISNAPANILNQKETLPSTTSSQDTFAEAEKQSIGSNLSWSTILFTLYIVGVVIFLLIFLVQVVILLTQRYNLNSFPTGKYTIVEMVKDAEPCSFLNYIFINPNKYDTETYEHIIQHEKAHIDQSHFVDKVIAELLVAIFWFNPFTWLLRKSISQNLEFLTDQSLLNQGIQKDKYQMSLLKVSVSNRPLNLTASYNSSFLKNRINMMNAKNSSVVAAWKYLFIVPLFALSMVSLNAVQGYDQMPKNNTPEKSETKIADSNFEHITREIDLPFIDKIALGMSGNLSLTYGTEQKITITGPEELIDQISTAVHVDNWQITYKNPGYRKESHRITVHAQMTDLTHLALSGDGNIRTTNRFEDLGKVYVALSGAGNIEFTGDAEFINTALSGTGNIEVNSNATKINTALSGTGNITFTGKGDDATFVCSGSGNISALDFESKSTTVVIDGTSSISVNSSDLLDVTAGGKSVISYRGNPQIKKDLKSEARLLRID